MTTFEIVALSLSVLGGLAGGLLAARYAAGRLRRADELAAQGWVCVGFDFIAGPVMRPPADAKEDAE